MLRHVATCCSQHWRGFAAVQEAAMMNRERERQSYQEWERKDDEFHLEQVGFRYWGTAEWVLG